MNPADAYRLKIVGGVDFEVNENDTFQESIFIEKLIIIHEEPIQGIKVWILLVYPSNILGYPSKYCTVITLPPRRNLDSSPILTGPP